MENNQFSWSTNTLSEGVRFLLTKSFDLREGEYKRAFLMQLNIFLMISTLLIIKPAVNGLFISKFGVENLPLAFVIVALVATSFSVFYARKLVKIPFHLLIRRTLIISVVSLLIFGILLILNVLVGWVIYVFYIWVAIFAVLTASQFWILANLVFNAREAKRLFGFIGAGAIAGGIFGGYLTSLLAPVIGAENLLFVSALLLSFCIPITKTVWRDSLSGKPQPAKTSEKITELSESPFQIIRHSKHLTYLAGIIGVSVIVAKLVDYQFNALASSRITDPDELTAFFGFWFSNFNLISLAIQLFLTRRVVGVYGVGTSLIVLPTGIFIGALFVLFLPSLFAAILIKLADASLKQSINKSAVELLALPIPLRLKNKAKTFIDVFVDSVATGIGGLILILLVNAFDLSTRFISLIILVILGVWFYFAFKVRKEYLKSFQLKIKQAAGNAQAKSMNFTNDSVIIALTRVLEKGNDKQKLWALQKTREHPNIKLFDSLNALLTDANSQIRAEAMRNLYFYRNKNITQQVVQLINDPVHEVKVSAFEYLLEHQPHDRMKLMQRYLYGSDNSLSGAALLGLAGELRNNPELKRKYELQQLIARRIKELSQEKDDAIIHFNTKTLLETIGKGNVMAHYGFIHQNLNGNHNELVKIAIKAAGLTLSAEFIDPLFKLVVNPQLTESTCIALAQYGPDLLPLLKAKRETSEDKNLRYVLPEVVAQIDSQQSIRYLFDMLNSEDFQERLNAINALAKLKARFSDLHFDKKLLMSRILEEAKLLQDTLSVLYIQLKLEKVAGKIDAADNTPMRDARKSLINLLEHRLDGGLERIFKLLGLKFPPDEITSAYRSFQSNKPDIRMSSIEFLDNLLDSRLKRVLIPLFETTLMETVSKDTLRQMNIHIPGEVECYTMLLEGNDIKVKLAVLYLISQLNDVSFLPLIQKHTGSKNPKVKDFALKAEAALLAN